MIRAVARASIFAILVLSFVARAEAQVDLGLPLEPKKAPIHGPGAALYAPDGPGPHPAVVLSHTCATLGRHVTEWAGRMVDAGYVALVVDHLRPRGVKFNCPDKNTISVTEYAQDATAGLKHLRALPFVDGRRVAHMGFSYGGMAGLRLASASFRQKHVGGEAFAAVIAFYPWCNKRTRMGGGDHQVNFYDDTDVPLLVLLGEADDDSPPDSCVEQAKKNAGKGLPVEWKLYPDATHGFDFSHLGAKPYRHQMGNRTVTFRYDPATVDKALQDSRAFLARHLGAAAR